jgi:hypothetical protein
VRKKLIPEIADIERGHFVTEFKQLWAEQTPDITCATSDNDVLHVVYVPF